MWRGVRQPGGGRQATTTDEANTAAPWAKSLFANSVLIGQVPVTCSPAVYQTLEEGLPPGRHRAARFDLLLLIGVRRSWPETPDSASR